MGSGPLLGFDQVSIVVHPDAHVRELGFAVRTGQQIRQIHSRGVGRALRRREKEVTVLRDHRAMSSIECQVAQGCVGDFIVIRGKNPDGSTMPVTITSETTIASDGRTRWKRGGQPTVYSGKQFWWSMHDPNFKEILDTRGKQDVESPLAEWTRVECVCKGNRITVIVNGTTVNECFDVFPSAGKILLESEGFEIFFRKFELHPIN